jgi:pimeloyl-ACP methyl ester carboxylesterase
MKIVKGEIALSRFLVPYRIYGEAKTFIVCVGGAKQTMAAWRSFVSHFIADYSIVVFDLPGQGRAKILSGDLGVTFEEQIDVLYSVIKETTPNNGSTILAAASWGTIISAAVAARYSDLIGAIMLGSFGVKPSKAVVEVIQAGQGLFNNNKTEKIAPLMIKKFGQNITELHKKQMISQFKGMNRQDFLSFYKHCEFVEQATNIEDFVTLEDITVPTLIVNGEYDAIIDISDIEKASTKIRDCELLIIPSVGHFLHWEQPEILHHYSEFINRKL